MIFVVVVATTVALRCAVVDVDLGNTHTHNNIHHHLQYMKKNVEEKRNY